MDYFTDIKLLPDAEIPATVLMNAIYTKLHKALCDLHSTNIGISFPKYKVTLGDVLRIHGKEPVLNDLQGLDWIGGMKGYCKISDIVPVPAGSKFRTISRKQPTVSQSKLNRLIKRGSITEDEVKNYKAKMFTKGLDNPYVELVSGSNGQRHRRYIEFGELQDSPVEGEFDQFGLSKIATVPWF
jgi:CRISPR-associated endonuclease Csy4